MPSRLHFLGLSFTVATGAEVQAAISQATPKTSLQIATLNPEFMLEAQTNPAFKRSLEQMPLCTIDGSGLFFFLRLWSRLKKQITPELYHGSDLVADLFTTYQNGEKAFFLLGGAPGISQQAKQAIEKHYPGINIVGETDGGMIDKNNVRLDPNLKKQLEKVQPDIILVGFGAPKQELWMQAAAKELTIPVMIGVGGTLDFYVKKRRAPLWMRSLHLEWLDRSLHEPGHWKRAFRAVVVFSLMASGWMLTHLSAKKA